MKQPNGEWTTDHQKILTAIADYWKEVMCPNKEIPTWEAFHKTYGHHLQGGKWPTQATTESEWITQCRKVRKNTAGGADGWGAEDLKALPEETLK